ncbi:sigma-70 family RNA polymerase sigma factor [Candidatus Vidania fulgoroideae]|uniref:RNA polymerase sigma factor n=1 Tax=Candidatus Vidania fulgoroideorum TaxID=881286 RepID=A0A974X7R0_9PROT|nr:sigma-70 family RNA polymerase sigma factor [Candidatus Vidania fulgoroideae]
MKALGVLSFDSEKKIFAGIELSILGIIRIVSSIPFLSFSILKLLKKEFNKKFKYEKFIIDFNPLGKNINITQLYKPISRSDLKLNLITLFNKLKRFNFYGRYKFTDIFDIISKFKYSNSFINYINSIYKNILFNFLKLEKKLIRTYLYLMSDKDISFFENRILNVTFLKGISYIRKKIQINNNTFYGSSNKIYKQVLILKKKIFIDISAFKHKSNLYFREIACYRGNRKKIIESNQRLIISISKNYRKKGLLFSDLLQEGNIGLIKSIERFEYRKGYKFSTYSTWWIRQSITRSIADNSRLIRIPVHMTEILSKINNIRNIYINIKSKAPSIEYIKNKLCISKNKIKKVFTISKAPISLNSKINKRKGNSTYEETLSNNCNSNDETLSNKEITSNIKKVLHFLNNREREVLKMRFGLSGNRNMTLEEIGRVFGVTRERIRQIENSSLNKIRNSSIINLLRNIKGR